MPNELFCRESLRLRGEYIQRLGEFNQDMRAYTVGTLTSVDVLKARREASRAAWDLYLAHLDHHACRHGKKFVEKLSVIDSLTSVAAA